MTLLALVRILFYRINFLAVDDVASHIVRNPLWEWQSLGPTSLPNATFYQFCEALEVKNGVAAPAAGWGLDTALPKFGAFLKAYLEADGCTYIPRCFELYGRLTP